MEASFVALCFHSIPSCRSTTTLARWSSRLGCTRSAGASFPRHAALRAARARARRWPHASPRHPPRWWRVLAASHVCDGRRSACRPSYQLQHSLHPVTTMPAARYATIRVAQSSGRELATPAARSLGASLRDGGACSPHPMSATGAACYATLRIGVARSPCSPPRSSTVSSLSCSLYRRALTQDALLFVDNKGANGGEA